MNSISNPFQMVVAIVALMVLLGIIRSRQGSPTMRWLRRSWDEATPNDPEKERLREELKDLKERVAVLERIVTDRGSILAQEIERLREPQN